MDVCPVAPPRAWPESDPSSRLSPGAVPDGAFGRVVEQYLAQSNALQRDADRSVLDLATGQTEDVHDVMLAVAKAELTFRTILEVRNRLTDAYQEVMRMQV